VAGEERTADGKYLDGSDPASSSLSCTSLQMEEGCVDIINSLIMLTRVSK